MPHDLIARRLRIQARLERAEKSLTATRGTASGHSRAILLHLEQEIHASKKDLALLDLQLADSASQPACPGRKQ